LVLNFSFPVLASPVLPPGWQAEILVLLLRLRIRFAGIRIRARIPALAHKGIFIGMLSILFSIFISLR
jgi:hypothetical protein